MGGYTVFDVETTGLFPEHTDRVVELGIAYVSHEGDIQGHWSTLINPGRDVGPTSIHGISASDVIDAPTFADVAPYVIKAMYGRALVAHNASFDLRFLSAELARVGVPVLAPLPGVCTMRWAPVFAPTAGRALAACCDACGIRHPHDHSAGGDALATAQLLSHYLKVASYAPPWTDALAASRQYPWPQFHGVAPELTMRHRNETALRHGAWLDRIVARMPRAGSPVVDEYLALLELAMMDGFLAEHEKDQLAVSAASAGLSRGVVLDLHASYLAALAGVAWEDGVVTDAERAELDRVAVMLGLTSADVTAALGDAEQSRTDSATVHALVAMCGLELHPGDRVVFTGEMSKPRSFFERLCLERGLVLGSVTKGTRLVVAADPNSLSGKAAKARDYGIPIVTEDLFLTLIDRLPVER